MHTRTKSRRLHPLTVHLPVAVYSAVCARASQWKHAHQTPAPSNTVWCTRETSDTIMHVHGSIANMRGNMVRKTETETENSNSDVLATYSCLHRHSLMKAAADCWSIWIIVSVVLASVSTDWVGRKWVYLATQVCIVCVKMVHAKIFKVARAW